MKKKLTNGVIFVFFLSSIISCSPNPTAKIQGIYEVNKDSLKATLQKEINNKNSLAMGLLNVILKNAVIEVAIKGDSIKGIIYLAGKTTLINSPIINRNDSLLIKTDGSEAYLIPTKNGLLYKVSGSKMFIRLDKTNRKELSPATLNAIAAQKKVIKEKKEFEKNLGKWQVGNYVDEFGDKTGEKFAYCIIQGKTENSGDVDSEIYIKAMIEGKKLSFQIFDNSLNMKESLPNNKFGIIKLKFPDGNIKSEKVFFYNNTIYESDNNSILYNYILQNDGIVKIYIDLRTADKFYSEKYHFEIKKNNLIDILKKIKK